MLLHYIWSKFYLVILKTTIYLEENEEVRVRRRTGGDWAATWPQPLLSSSSGSGPSIEPPLAELTPDMADTEIFSSVWVLELEIIRNFFIRIN